MTFKTFDELDAEAGPAGLFMDYAKKPTTPTLAGYDTPETITKAKEIAERAKTSTATVSRFIRTLGFKNYAELKFSLSQSKDGDETKNSPSLPTKKGSLEDLWPGTYYLDKVDNKFRRTYART